MSDLIDRKHFDKALEDVLIVASGKIALGKEPKIVSELTIDYISQVRKWLAEEPSVDPETVSGTEPVVHARWERMPYMDDSQKYCCSCSRCGRIVSRYHGTDVYKDCPYCHCGAKMVRKDDAGSV